MKSLIVLTALVTVSIQGSAFAGLFHRTWGDAIIVTEMTPQGRLNAPASKDKPVYFIGQSLGCRLGSVLGDREPDVQQMNKHVAKILEKQGYLAADPKVQEPTQFLVLQWGYVDTWSYSDTHWFMAYDGRRDITLPSYAASSSPGAYRLGARARSFELVQQDAMNPVYGIIVTAFDYKSASTNKPIALWQTRIGLPAIGKSMQEALPVMATLAGPVFGRETKDPMLGDTDELRRGRYEYSDFEVLEVIAPTQVTAPRTN